MPVNLSALSSLSNSALTLSNLILVTPQEQSGYQPQNKNVKTGQIQQTLPTLLFNYEGEQSVSLESDITDHFIEDNTAVQDQIALRPEIITTHGFIGELTDIAPRPLKILKTVADKLYTLVAYTPELTTTGLLLYNQAFQAYQTAEQAANAASAAWNSLKSQGAFANQTKQAKMFQQFYGYWKDRTLFTVQTPWAKFNDCAIRTLKAIQNAETKMITDFEVSFKKMRFAKTSIINNSANNFQGRSLAQSSGLVDFGASSPVETKTLSEGLVGVI